MLVGFSADFLDASGKPVFPAFGLDILDGAGISHRFLDRFEPEYKPGQLHDLDAVLSLKPRVTRASLEGIERLAAIGRYGVGYDNVDLKACTDRNVCVYITPDAVIRPMASSIALLVLAVSHNLVWKDRLIRQGRWKESISRLGIEPRGRIVGTIGLGNIAAEALRLLKTFEIQTFLAYDPYASPARAAELGATLVSLEELLQNSDYVLVNCPLTEETRGLLNEERLGLLKPSAFLINTARGPIVDEKALARMLAQGRIRGAALDVFEREPLEHDSPLLGLENVTLTSHSIGWTEELFRDMGKIACAGVLALRSGQPPANVVNPDVLRKPEFQRKLDRMRNGAAA